MKSRTTKAKKKVGNTTYKSKTKRKRNGITKITIKTKSPSGKTKTKIKSKNKKLTEGGRHKNFYIHK